MDAHGSRRSAQAGQWIQSFNPHHTPTLRSFKIHFNIILIYTQVLVLSIPTNFVPSAAQRALKAVGTRRAAGPRGSVARGWQSKGRGGTELCSARQGEWRDL